MYTKADLIHDLKDMGLETTDALMVHSSMKSIGEVKGGADTVVDAFMEYLNVKRKRYLKFVGSCFPSKRIA